MSNSETELYEQAYDSLPTLPPWPWYAPLSEKDKAKFEIYTAYVYIDKYSETSRNYTTTGSWGTSTDHLVTLDLIKWSTNRVQDVTDTSLTILATWRYFIWFTVTPYFVDNAQLVSPFIRVTHLDTTIETVTWCEVWTYDPADRLNDTLNCQPMACNRVMYLQKWEIIEVYVKVTTGTASWTSGRASFSGNRRVNPHLTLHKLS